MKKVFAIITASVFVGLVACGGPTEAEKKAAAEKHVADSTHKADSIAKANEAVVNQADQAAMPDSTKDTTGHAGHGH